jgi:diaminopimelate decarboxylase
MTTQIQTWQGQTMTPLSFKESLGDASIGGVSVAALAKTYGTPLYVIDGETLRHACREYQETLTQHYTAGHQVVLACKSNFNLGLAKLIASEGLGCDVVSAGELMTAIQAGISGDKIVFNGNLKSEEEIALAIDHKVSRIILDNFDEIERVAKIAKSKGVKVNVLARVAPGIECHTHDYIKTGQNDSKFGFPLARVDELLDAVLKHPEALDFKGIHGHVGSQIFELRAYQDLVTIFFTEMDRIRQQYGITLPDLDLGGGWGIAYTHADTPLPIPTLIQTVVEAVKASAEALDYPLPRLLFEPGRSLMARAGVTLYTVGGRKEVEGAFPYISVDGGMGDNIRPALYQAEYSACVVSQLGKSVATEAVRVVGKYCESGDVVLRHFEGPRMGNGDLLLVFGTGAYNYTMASTYNRIGRPAMVLVENGKHGLLVERESVQDLLALDRIPNWL